MADDNEEVLDEGVSTEAEERGTSLSDDLEAAWADSEAPADEAGGSDGGDSASPDGDNGSPVPDAVPGGSGTASAETPVSAESETVGKPPLDWSPELREEWAGLPAGVKTQIANREAQMSQAMQGTAQARRVAQEFTGVANQYGSVMAAEGVQNPVEMFDATMRVVSELRMGTTQQKANRIASMVSAYGVDIQALDDALAGTISGEPQAQGGNPDLEAMLDKRMQPVNDMMQQLAGMQQQKQQASAYEAQNEVNTFAQSAEFLNDVRHDVADLIDLATKQGREMPLQEAYDKACAMNPQIANVLAQRAQQQSIADAGRNVSSKRMAAASLRPGNIGANSQSKPATLYDSISAAWDDQIGG